MQVTSKRRRNVDEWRAVFARQASSELSVQAFCARESLNISSFYRWRRLAGDPQARSVHERSVAAHAVVKVPSPRGSIGAAEGPQAQAEFVDLGQLRSHHSVELRLDLGGGVLLTLVR